MIEDIEVSPEQAAAMYRRQRNKAAIIVAVLAIAVLAMFLGGCVSDSIKYDPSLHIIEAHRTAFFTNIGELHVSADRSADGAIRANVDEMGIDQTTAAANALTAAAQLALKAAKPAP